MKTVYILGAGVDIPFGLPLADGLLRELDAFAKGEGKAISKAIKDKLGGGRRVRFSFEKYVANQGENFAERVMSDADLAESIASALKKLQSDDNGNATIVKEIVERLQSIRIQNQLEPEMASRMAVSVGESEEMADHELIRMRGVALNPIPRTAMLKVFRQAQLHEAVSVEDKRSLDFVVAAMTNFEELLTELFAGFYARNNAAMRNYLYVSWLLWSYMRWRSMDAQSPMSTIRSFYDCLGSLGSQESVITFNYTVFPFQSAPSMLRFHGDCTSYIRHDQGEMIPNDESVSTIVDLDSLRLFFEELEMNLDEGHVYLPAIVPPSAMKPVINREFIDLWSRSAEVLRAAELLIVAGYAFNPIDNHFNDLFRREAEGKRVVIINPDIEGSLTAVRRVLGVSPESLTKIAWQGTDVRRSNRVMLLPRKAEDVSEDELKSLKNGW